MKTLCFLAAVILAATSPAKASAEPEKAPARKLVVAYVPNWGNLKGFAAKIDYSRVTHLNIAFENPTDDDGTLSFRSSNGAVLEQAKKHGVKVLVSIGGGSASTDPLMQGRYKALMAPEKRRAFAVKLADYVVIHGFDGLDVDIEGPSITPDYGSFIEELAPLLKAKGKLLTAALSRGYGGDQVPDSTLGRYDFLNIMAYDATGPWSPDQPGQHSSLEFAKSCVDYWLGRGLPKEKAVLGVPFYCYGFGDGVEKRSYSYREILDAYPGADQKDEVGTTIWYNGAPTIRAKAQLTLDRDLAGVMIWSLNSDAEGDASLLKVLDEALRKKTTPPEK